MFTRLSGEAGLHCKLFRVFYWSFSLKQVFFTIFCPTCQPFARSTMGRVEFSTGDMMASGRKNYFRHVFGARNDDKVQDLVEKFGPAGYFYWFVLVEICAERAADEMPEKFIYHQRTLIKELRLHKNKLRVFLEYSASISLLSYTYTENRVEVCIPNLSKFMGQYASKYEPKPSNKRKGKESKVKESKVKEIEGKYLTQVDDIRKKHYPRKGGEYKNATKKILTDVKNDDDVNNFRLAVNNYAFEVKDRDAKYVKLFSSFAGVWKDFINSDYVNEINKNADDLEKLLGQGEYIGNN